MAIIIDLDAAPAGGVQIGRQGEYDFREVVFNMGSWVADYPGGKVTIVFERPDGKTYPVVTAASPAAVTWTLSAADLSVAGAGRIEARISTETGLGKSAVIPVSVAPSITDVGVTPQNPVPDWTYTVAENANRAEAAAAAAEEKVAEVGDTVNAALAEAKASGEFDGPKGDKGDTGPVGPQGPPGEGVSKLVVTLMSEDMENWTADKSFAEIAAALESGGEVEASLMGMIPVAFFGYDGSSVLFQKLGLMTDGSALENYTAIIMDNDAVTVMIQNIPLSGGGGMVVNVTSEDGELFNADKTYEEIAAAVESGTIVVANAEGTYLLMVVFGTLPDGSEGVMFQADPTVEGQTLVLTLTIRSDNSVSVEAVPGGGGGQLVVTFTDDGNGNYTASATYEEVVAAIENGMSVVGVYNEYLVPLVNVTGEHAYFATISYPPASTMCQRVLILMQTNGYVWIETDLDEVLTRENLEAGLDNAAVRFDKAQTLTAAQKAQARANIGVTEGGTTDTTGTVRYDVAQGLTAEQQEQARKNIDAEPATFVVNITGDDVTDLTADKTVDEILAAVNSGKKVEANVMGARASLLGVMEGDGEQLAVFSKIDQDLYADTPSISATTILVWGSGTVIANSSSYPLATKTSELENDAGFVSAYNIQDFAFVDKDTARKNIGIYETNVRDYGADSYGVQISTTAFQNAIAANRVVHVPGGTYNLSGEIVIPPNCSLVLEQDTVLNFTNTSGNCISMHASASIIGNHGLIKVPYGFTGKVINIDAGLDESIVAVPPFTAWGPMYTAARYITDLHIGMFNSLGTAWSEDGTCTGTAVYLGARATDPMHFMWAIDLDRLRIAGGFKYGIHMDVTPGETEETKDQGWIHQTRISGFIDGCETGVYCKDATMSYFSVMVIPQIAENKSRYAKNGFVLERCTEVDMSGARVIDWDSRRTLWAEGNEYQHIKLIGNCHGLILNDILYFGDQSHDIRDRIWTDTPGNLENINILQEPFTRWFKPREGVPYFYDGTSEKPLMLREELKEIVDTERTADFTNKVPTAINLDGTILNGTGYYESGYRWNGTDGALVADEWYGCIGLIPIKQGDVIRFKNLPILLPEDGYCQIIFYDASFKKIMNVARNAMMGNAAYYWVENFVQNEDGFEVQIATTAASAAAAYFAISFHRNEIGENPIITVNEPITYKQEGYLQDGILVKVANVEGLDAILGSYINDVDALLGGG